MDDDKQKEMYICGYCQKMFSSNSEVTTHISCSHSEDLCGLEQNEKRGFRNESQDVEDQVQPHSVERPHQCDQRVGKNLSNHEVGGKLFGGCGIDAGEEFHKLDECKKCVVRNSSLEDCDKTHTEEKLYKCKVCGMAFYLQSNLTSHLGSHTEERVCCAHDNSGSALNHHVRLRTGERRDHCGKSFEEPSNLIGPVRTLAGEKPFKCDHCEKLFTWYSDLNRHIRTHTGEKPYKCDHCKKSFNQQGTLISHVRTHTGEKPYICHHCGKLFNQHGHLIIHTRTHTGEKPYKCDLCEKSFTSHGDLKSHFRIHTGEKPYTCNHCRKSFSRHGDLIRHVRTHTGEKPYRCNLCEKSFTRHDSLIRHVGTHADRGGTSQR